MYLSTAANTLDFVSNNKTQESILDPLIADKIFREKIVGVSGVTWWNWRKQGKLPKSLMIGRRRFYRRSDIEVWLEELVSEKSSTGN